MNFRESGIMALESIRANKFRAFLTTLGIIIGVWAVIGVQTFISGLNATVSEQLSDLGAGTFLVQKYPAIRTGDERYRNRKDITLKQVNVVRDKADLVSLVSPTAYTFGKTIKYYDKKTNPDVFAYGGNELWQMAGGYFVKEGRFITASDVQRRTNACILGLSVVEKLFPFEDAIGKEIRLEGQRLQVVGVFEEEGKTFGQDRDNIIFIPITTFEKIFGKKQELQLSIKARTPELLAESMDQVIGILRAERKVPPGKPNDFEILTKESLMETWANLTRYVFLGAILIAGMSLLVGGIGIMNIMLVSVTERTREIGIRKAIGASRLEILWQFITEAIILSGVGGVVGIIFGVLSGILLGVAIGWPTTIPVLAATVGFVFSSAVGLFFGIYPAVKASQLNPIEALRYE
jgi:putative ABC transport system permease protein